MSNILKTFKRYEYKLSKDGDFYPAKVEQLEHDLNPGRTIRADIRLDMRKITDVRVELSVTTDIHSKLCALIFVTHPSGYPCGHRCC